MNLDPFAERQGFDQAGASQEALRLELNRVRNELSEGMEALVHIMQHKLPIMYLEADVSQQGLNELLESLLHVGEHLQWGLNP